MILKDNHRFSYDNIYISVVFNSRNDGYPGGKGLELLQISTNDMIEQLDALNFFSEVLIIDYNPPIKKKKLKDVLKLKLSSKVTVKFIEVDKKYHVTQKHSDKFPLNPEFAQNVGIQRAKGKFILSKSSDTIINKHFFEFIGKMNLSNNFFYRCPRIDINSLDFIKKNFVIQDFVPKTKSNILISSGGDFILMSSSNWKKVGGYWENNEAYQDGSDSILLNCAYELNIKEHIIKNCYVFKPIHDFMYHKRTNYRPKKLNNSKLNIYYYILIRILEKIGFITKKALITSKDGSGETIEINVYCFDLIKKIKNKKIIPPLNKDANWGLKYVELNETVLKLEKNNV